MKLTAKYQPKRDQYWPEVEQFFDSLPPNLFCQSVLLKNNLATFYSNTGQFKDILRREQDQPLLYLHFWLLDDFQIPNSDHRTALERRLFLAMVFNFATVYTHETILDKGSNFDPTFQYLAQALTQQADFHLAQLFSGESAFWQYHRTYWAEYTEASLVGSADRRPVTAEAATRKMAYNKISVAAVATGTRHAVHLPQLEAMMDRFNFIVQTLTDISTIRRDLARRHFTYPLARTLTEAGIEPHQPVEPKRLLGALVLTGTVGKICEECLSALAECRAAATLLSLPTFNTYFDIVEGLVGEVREMFDVRAKPRMSSESTDPEPPRRMLFAPAVDTAPKVIEMAEGYLLADPTFRESWEVQRRGTFGVPEMTAKAFPAGLIVEILCRHGHDMAAAVDEIFQTLQATGFRYFDFPDIPPDADDLGLLLRLFPYSRQQAAHRDILKTPLRWLDENVGRSGEIPVWFTRQTDFDDSDRQSTALWGQTCVTVEANLLLGLLDYDGIGYQAVIEKSARSILERWINRGLSATLHYVPLYSLWVGFELIARLAAGPLQTVLRNRLDPATQILTERLEIEAGRNFITPQDAAFLTLACLSDEAPVAARGLFSPRWIDILCKSQRYDGSWAGEPLYGTPTRGEFAAWYNSRPVTTAFCYHALKRDQEANAK